MINKINTQVATLDAFTPWEESFINLARSFDPSAAPKPPLRRHYLTLDPCKGHSHHEKSTSSRRELGRTQLTLSKINLRSSSRGKEEQLVIQQRSTRYPGPRITFYSKMNPNCSHLLPPPDSLRHSLYDSRLGRDKSVNYLDIRQDNDEPPPRQGYNYLRSIYPVRAEKDLILPRKKEPDYHTMRRLKILANNRKLSQR